jgi:Protein of unknown function (DUF1071)
MKTWAEGISQLLETNVNAHTEKKKDLTYLSWAWAWAEALKADPAATYKVEMFGDKCYMDINGTAMVWVTVTMFNKPMTCQLPVMDHTNTPIPFAGRTIVNKYNKEIRIEFDSFAVNTAIMRCMTKALSLHGLGLYIYAGEDLPEGEETPKPVPKHTPTKPVQEMVQEDRKEILLTSAKFIVASMDAGEMEEALAEWEAITDPEEKTHLWSLLDSKYRSAIKKAKNG